MISEPSFEKPPVLISLLEVGAWDFAWEPGAGPLAAALLLAAIDLGGSSDLFDAIAWDLLETMASDLLEASTWDLCDGGISDLFDAGTDFYEALDFKLGLTVWPSGIMGA